MQEIPDTGPGLSGFLAHLLWQLYGLMPSPRQNDWLWLFAVLTSAALVLYLPWFWKTVRLDMKHLETRTSGEWKLHQEAVEWWFMCWMVFLLWLFSTQAGVSFLKDGRVLFARGSPALGHDGAFTVGLLVISLLLLLAKVVVNHAIRQKEQNSAGYGLHSLDPRARGRNWPPGLTFSSGYSTFFGVWLGAGWFQFATASDVLTAYFLAAAVLTDLARVLIVYFWYRRALGRSIFY